MRSDATRSIPFAAKARRCRRSRRCGFCCRTLPKGSGFFRPATASILSNEQILERARNIVTGLLGNYRIRSLEAREFRGARLPLSQMDLLDQLERRAEARNNGRPGRA